MNIKDQETKDRMIQRLRRIEGQIRGVTNMLEEDRDCQEILQQLSAARSALQSASRLFLQEYATTCLMEMAKEDDSGKDQQAVRLKHEKVVQEMIALLDKAP